MQIKPLSTLHGSTAAIAPAPKPVATGQNGDFSQLLKTAQAEPAKASATPQG